MQLFDNFHIAVSLEIVITKLLLQYYIQLYLQHSQDSRETFAQVSYDSRETFIRVSHNSHVTIVRVSKDVLANVAQFKFRN